MPKKKFFNIFSRSSKSQTQEDSREDHLVTDAVPAPDENSNESSGNVTEEIHNSTPFPSGILTSAEQTSQQLVHSPLLSNGLSPSPLSCAGIPQNNNMLAVHNTHAQNVFQFSNVSNLQIGSVYKIGWPEADAQPSTPSVANLPSKEHRTKPKDYTRFTRTIQTMLQSNEPLSQKHLSEISRHLGEGWQEVMRKLKFSDGQIHQATVDNHIDGGLKEVIYQLLLDWTRNEDNATIGEITSVLWNSGHHETVDYLKKVYKAERNLQNNQTKSEKAEKCYDE